MVSHFAPLRKHVAIAVAYSCLLLATACSGGSDGAGSATGEGVRSGRESFSAFPQYKLSMLNYAKAKATAECMSKAGYPQLSQASIREPDNSVNELKVTPARFGPPDEGHAKRYGFGFGMDIPAQSPSVVSYDAGFDRNLQRCGKQSWQKVGTDAQRVHDTYMELFNTLGQEHDAALRKHADWERLNQALLACLAEGGYKPANVANPLSPGKGRGTGKDSASAVAPRNFGVRLGGPRGDDERWRPTARQGTVQIGPAVPPRPYVPTAGEIKFAVAYAKCNQKLGRTKVLMDRSAEIQDQVMSKHETEISELNNRLDQLVRQAGAMTGKS